MQVTTAVRVETQSCSNPLPHSTGFDYQMTDSTSDSLISCTTTVATKEQASELAMQLVSISLAACVQIDGPIESHYQWEGKLCCEREFRLTIKTTQSVWLNLEKHIQENHPYDEPQLVGMLLDHSSVGYRNWVLEQTEHRPTQP